MPWSKAFCEDSIWAIIRHIMRNNNEPLAYVFVPAGGTDEGKRDELVPERIILWKGFCAHQGLQAGVIRQVTDLAGVGTHLCWLWSARLTALYCFFTKHMPNPKKETWFNQKDHHLHIEMMFYIDV